MKTTLYFTKLVMPRRPELKQVRHRIEQAITAPLASTRQADGRIRRWVFVPETGEYLRVVLEADGETVHNAFYDRRFSDPRRPLAGN